MKLCIPANPLETKLDPCQEPIPKFFHISTKKYRLCLTKRQAQRESEAISTSRRQSIAVETRSVSSSNIHHVYVLRMQKMPYFSHTWRGLSPVIFRQLTLPPTLLSPPVFSVFFPLCVGGGIGLEIVDGVWPLSVFPPTGWTGSWFNNETGSYYVGVLRLPFLNMCLL